MAGSSRVPARSGSTGGFGRAFRGGGDGVAALVAVPALYAVAGVALAAGALAVDSALGPALPFDLGYSGDVARNLLITLSGAYVTVVAIVFWVRVYAVQMIAQPFTPEVMRTFLTAPVQRHSMAFIIGALTFNLTALLGLPGQDSGEETPQLTAGIAALVAILVAGAVVFSVHNAARSAQIGTLIRWLADRCQELVLAIYPERSEGAPERADAPERAEAPPGEPQIVVPALDSGWVQRIDHRRLLGALPPGGIARLAIRVGDFVVRDRTLAEVWTEETADREPLERELHAAIEVGPDPTLEQHLALGIRQLVDIAERSLSFAESNSTTAREAILHIGIVMRELLLRDLPPARLEGHSGTALLRPHEQDFEDLVAAAFDRTRLAVADSPEPAITTLSTLAMLVEEVERAGLRRRAEPLRAQARLLVSAAERHVSLPHDAARIRDQAARSGLIDAGGGAG